MNIEQAVAFSILMQNGHGILEKSPSYILEKLHSIENEDNPKLFLDSANRITYNEYFRIWKNHLGGIE